MRLLRLGTAAVAIVALPAIAGAGDGPVLGTPGESVRVSIADVLHNEVVLDLKSLKGQKIVLYSLQGSVSTRLKDACQLSVGTDGKAVINKDAPDACRVVLSSTAAVKLAISKLDEVAYAELIRPEIEAYAGVSADIEVKSSGKGDRKSWDWPAFAKTTVSLALDGVSGKTDPCYILRAGGWVSVHCEMKPPLEAEPPAGKPPDGALLKQTLAVDLSGDSHQKIIEDGLTAGSTYTVVAHVVDKASPPEGAWRKLTLKPAIPEPPADPETPAACTPSPLPMECLLRAQRLLGPVSPKPDSVSEASQTPAAAATLAPFYALCVDYADVANPSFAAYEITNGVAPDATKVIAAGYRAIGSMRFQTRKSFHVFVQLPVKMRVEVAFNGAEGWASAVHDRFTTPSGGKANPPARGAECTEGYQIAHFPQSPQLAGTATLQVKILDTDDKKTELGNRTWKLSIDNFVSFAIRLGLGFHWQPLARQVDELTMADGTRYSAVTGGDGNPSGLFGVEFMVGATWFPKEISETAMEPSLGLGAYLGVLQFQQNKLDGLTSLSIGPELTLGPDFSIGLVGGIRRNYVPKRGFEPGHVLPSGKSLEKDGLELSCTPTLGFVLNFTPSILRSVFSAGGGT